jgi:hypothetical protein
VIAGFDATLAEGRGRLTTGTGLEVATADGEGKVPRVWIAGCVANVAARGRNSGAAARGTKAGADADSCGLWDAEPRGGMGGRALAVLGEDGPCWTAGWPSMVRAEEMTFELRSWSTVKSVQSQYQAEQLHTGTAFFGGELTPAQLDVDTATGATSFPRGGTCGLSCGLSRPADGTSGAGHCD